MDVEIPLQKKWRFTAIIVGGGSPDNGYSSDSSTSWVFATPSCIIDDQSPSMRQDKTSLIEFLEKVPVLPGKLF